MAYHPTDDQVASKLGGSRPSGDGGWYCRCPTHEDNKASLWIKQRNGGGLLVKCHAGCARENVEQKLREMKLWPEAGIKKPVDKNANKRRRMEDEVDEILAPVPADAPSLDFSKFYMKENPHHLYPYKDGKGRLIGYVARWDTLTEGKTILPVSYARLKGKHYKWVLKGPPKPYHLYKLPELAERLTAPVLIVEGEKAADAAAKHFPDHVCLCWRGGAGSFENSDFNPLRDRDVILWPDADEAGKGAMQKVASLLNKIGAASVRTVAIPDGLPKGWDVADAAPEGLDLKALLTEATEPSIEAAAAEDEQQATEENDQPKSYLTGYVVSATDLIKMDLPKREAIVGNWITTSSLAMIYALRGLGKTWWSLSLGVNVAAGENFLDYEVSKPWRVLYVDGEMALSDLQYRVMALDPNPPENMMLLPSELLFREAKPINLHEEADQQAILGALEDLEGQGRRPDLIIFDNLSSLSGGVDENDNSALDSLLRWLVKLKHLGYAILLVHHTGKGGTQRGASRREDLLDTSVALTPPDDDAEPHDGASFNMQFPKTRGQKPKPFVLEMRLRQDRYHLVWAYNEPKKKINREAEALKLIWERKPNTQKELAKLMGVTEGAVSGYCQKLRRAKKLDSETFTLTLDGRDALLEAFPELEAKMLKQGDMFTGKEL